MNLIFSNPVVFRNTGLRNILERHSNLTRKRLHNAVMTTDSLILYSVADTLLTYSAGASASLRTSLYATAIC